MCDFSGKLMAWLDGELPAGDAADVQRHLLLCSPCRGQVEAYRRVTGAFDEYCDAYYEGVAAVRSRRKPSRLWLTAAGAAAAVAALILFVPRERVQPLPARAPDPVGNVAAQRQAPDGNEFPSEPAVEISIPADAIFPPGAVPDGVSFTADVTISPDGSAQQIRLRPQLTGFERRSTRP